MEASGIDCDARSAMLQWFDTRGRAFPFREVRDPYSVWICETMAQQTQIERAASKLTAFLDRFPTVQELATAARADVLRAWRGLGYNRRALYLHRAAQVVVAEHGGRLPSDVSALQRLPGVGPYTARAVAAFAFGQPVAPVDTNVRRVLRRLAGDPSAWRDKDLQRVADASVVIGRPADWTHAVMDLGATICRARSPRCRECPVRQWCGSAGSVDLEQAVRSKTKRGSEPFSSTTRWLRGQLLDRLRDAPARLWTPMTHRVGDHDARAVRRALEKMAAEGLVEVRGGMPLAARLPADS